MANSPECDQPTLQQTEDGPTGVIYDRVPTYGATNRQSHRSNPYGAIEPRISEATVPNTATKQEWPVKARQLRALDVFRLLEIPSEEYPLFQDTEDSTAGQTAGDSDCYKLAFYNIGSDVPATPTIHALSSEISEICDMIHDTNKRIVDSLTSGICDMVHDKCVDAVGISVLFNPKDDRWQQLQAIMEQVVWKLNSSSEWRANSADGSAQRPAWKGESDGHYVVVWNSHRLILKAYEVIVYHYPFKMAKDLQFQQAEWPSGPPLQYRHYCSDVRPVPVVVSVRPGRNAARPVPVVLVA